MDSTTQTNCSRMVETASLTVPKPSKEEIMRQYVREMIHLSCDEQVNNLVTLRTIHYRILARVLEALGLSWIDLCDVVQNHTLVHPEVAQQLIVLSSNDEEIVNLFSQDFIKTERVARLLKLLFRGGRRNEVDALVAVDGLVGPISAKGPIIHSKWYVANLRFGLSETANLFDSKEELKRIHVRAVRQLYNKLDERIPNVRFSPLVYEILCECFKESTGVELPSIRSESLTEELMEECKGLYMSCVGKDNMAQIVEGLKIKPVKSDRLSTDKEPEKKKRKRSLETKK